MVQRIVFVASLILALCTSQALASGCATDPKVGLIVDHVGDDTEFTKAWALTCIPDVGSGPKKISTITYVDGPKAYTLYLTLAWDASDQSILVSASLATRGNTLHEEEWQGDVDDMPTIANNLRALFLSLRAYLYAKLPVTNSQVQFDRHALDATSPGDVTATIKGLTDPFGNLPSEADASYYCFAMRLKDQKRKTQEVFFTEKDVKEGKTHSFDMTGWPKSCNKVDDDACARPVAKPQIRLVSAFGFPEPEEDKRIPTQDPPEVTLMCPVKVENKPTIVFKPGEKKPIPFKVTGYDGKGIPNVLVEDIAIDPEDFGSLSHDKVLTAIGHPPDEEGVTEHLMLKAASDVEGAGVVTGRICKNTPESKLGKDAAGNPIGYSEVEVVGHQNVAVFPQIRVTVIGEVDIDKDLTTTNTSNTGEHSVRDVDQGNQNLELRFTAQFHDRQEHKVNQPDLGFKGRRVSYIGKTTDVELQMGTTSPRKHNSTEFGWFKTKDCGRVTFNYHTMAEKHSMKVLRPNPQLDVFYHHYIPDPDSPKKTHPFQGLSFTGILTGGEVFNYTIKIASFMRDSKPGACSVTVRPGPAPSIPVPLALDQYLFPAPLLLMTSGGCFGSGQALQPLQETMYRKLFRQLNDDGTEFDEYVLDWSVNLSPGDNADCWECDDSGSRYEGNASASLYIESRAEVVAGSFDLNCYTSIMDLKLPEPSPYGDLTPPETSPPGSGPMNGPNMDNMLPQGMEEITPQTPGSSPGTGPGHNQQDATSIYNEMENAPPSQQPGQSPPSPQGMGDDAIPSTMDDLGNDILPPQGSEQPDFGSQDQDENINEEESEMVDDGSDCLFFLYDKNGNKICQ